MIVRSFKHKGLKAFLEKGDVKGIPPSHAQRLRECLTALHAAMTPYALPRSIAHPMARGSALAGLWAIKVTAQWRIVFRSNTRGECFDVDYVNYHH